MFRPFFLSLRSSRFILVLAACLVGLGAAGAARAARSPAGHEKPHVYTDEDLRSLRKPLPPQPAEEEKAPEAGRPQTRPQSLPQTRPQTQAGPSPGAQTRPSAVAGAAGKPEDASWTEDWRHDAERREFWQRRIRVAEDRVAQIEQRLEYLQRKQAWIENPFLPRPALTPEELEEERGMDSAALLARVQGQIGQAQQDLEQARQAVEAAKAEAEKALAPRDLSGWNSPSN